MNKLGFTDYFARITETDAGCWAIQGKATGPHGYVVLGARGSRVYGHRMFYENLVGAIPSGLDIDHLCRNRACLNPRHMEPVQRRENLRRGINHVAEQMAQTHCKRGHPLPPARHDGRRVRRRCNPCNAARLARARARAAGGGR